MDWIYLYIIYIIYNVIVIDWNDARYNARIKTSSYWYVIIYIKITQIAIIRIGRDLPYGFISLNGQILGKRDKGGKVVANC